ncbi:hypothetical protein ES702_02819 [subsurface metagenome]
MDIQIDVITGEKFDFDTVDSVMIGMKGKKLFFKHDDYISLRESKEFQILWQ